MDDGAVSDSDVCSNEGWISGSVIGAVVADVDDGAVLDVSACANPYLVDIATDDCLWPYRDIVAQDDITNHGAGWIDVYGATQLWCLVQEWADRVHVYSRWMRSGNES